VDPELQALSAQLAASAVRNSARAVTEKIGALRAAKHDRDTVVELEEIITTLISDKTEVIQIAQAFEEQLVSQRISEQDIDYVTANVVPLVRKLAEASDSAEETEKTIALLEPVLSVETLKILQVLGFNFRKAIGEPLTDLVSAMLQAQRPTNPNVSARIKELELEMQVAYLRVASDPESFERLQKLNA